MFKNTVYFLFFTLLISPLFLANVQVKAASFIVTNTNSSGAGSLYQAIIDANNSAGLDNINFNLVGVGPFTIDLSAFSTTIISDSLNIDGLTQPGSTASNPLIKIKNTTLTNFSSTVSSMSFNGLILENTTLMTVSNNIQATNNKFISTPNGSLNIKNATLGTISNNTFSNGLGAIITNSNNLNISNNTFNNTSWGINFVSGVNNNNTISNNTFTGGANGVGFNDGSNNLITNNTFNSTSFATNINQGSNNQIKNNTFDSTSWPINNSNQNSTSKFNIFSQNSFLNTFWDIQNFNAANQNINPPVIESVQTVGSNLIITGYAKTGSKIEIYRSVANGSNANSSYITTLTEGSANDSNNSTGPNDTNGLTTSRFTFTIPVPAAFTVGNSIRATATDSLNNTSQFSNKVIYTQAATPVSPSLSLTSSKNPSLVNESINLTATLDDTLLTGNIEFFNGNVSLGLVPINAGVSILSTSSLPQGSNNIKAVYTLANLSAIEDRLVQVVNAINTVPNPNINANSGGTTLVLSAQKSTIIDPKPVVNTIATTNLSQALKTTETVETTPSQTPTEAKTSFKVMSATDLIRTGGETNEKARLVFFVALFILASVLIIKSNQQQN